jgi:hypothetical protein
MPSESENRRYNLFNKALLSVAEGLGTGLIHLRDSSLPKSLIFLWRWFLFRKNFLKSMIIFRFLLLCHPFRLAS